jgi:hypothetical protein
MVMVLKIVLSFVVSHSQESFLGEIFDVMISNLFLRVCESLGMNIMFVVLLLYGGKWCKLWSK